MSGRPRRKALLNASIQKSISIVNDSDQLNTNRLNQSITATRYTKPCAILIYVISGAPDLIGTVYRHSSQQVRVNLVAFPRPTQLGFRVDSLDSHHLHKTRDALAIHLVSLGD